MGGKFDITAAFQAAVRDVSDSDTSRDQIEYIDIALLREDPGNFYSLDGIDELAANIQLCGLQQPIRVRAGEDGSYTIVSGHRRRAALSLLAREEPDKWSSVPCIMERDQASPELRELRLILANASTRVLSPAEVAKQAAKVEELLVQLKEQGYQFPGRMRDQVAAACQVSASKLARLKVIREHLIPSWLDRFEAGQLAEAPAYLLARQSAERQEWVADMYTDGYHAKFEPTESSITGWLEGLDKIDAVQCPKAGGECHNRDGMRSKLAVSPSAYWHTCTACCGECSSRDGCEFLCPMVADQVRREREEREEQLARDAAEVERNRAARLEWGAAPPPWHYGEPTEDGFSWCVTGPLADGGKLLYWHEDRWEFASAKLENSSTVVCWMPCPPIPTAQSWKRVEV